jgi:hypothetical protein
MNASLTQELLLVKQQLAEAKLVQNTSDEAKKTAEDAQAKLLEQMEKNYLVAQRVQEEKSKRQEGDHFIKGLRDQMKEASARAMRVASELEREKLKNIELRKQLTRFQKNKMERLDDFEDDIYEDDTDHDEDRDDELSDDDEVEDPQTFRKDNNTNDDENHNENNNENSNENSIDHRVESVNVKSRKKKRRKKRRIKRAKSATNGSSSIKLRTRPSTSSSAVNLSTTRSSNRIEEKLRHSKNHSIDLFHRLADAKRTIKRYKLESSQKSKQLHALSNHLEKMMALLRAEAAAKASAEEALRSTEDELIEVKEEKAMLHAQLKAQRLSEKDEMSRDHMLTKQLELMDMKYATLMKTNNFNRAKEKREAKELRDKMHQTTENMHTMLRRCEDSEIANRNTIHALSSLISNLSKMDRTPFRLNTSGPGLGLGLVPYARNELIKSGSKLESEMIIIELQDCSLGDKGGLEIMKALNVFITEESEKHAAVLDLKKKRMPTTVSAEATTGGGSDSSNISGGVVLSNDLDLIEKRRPPVRISLNLSFNNISDKNNSAFVKCLCRSIVATHCITEIDLRGNSIGGQGMKMILDALQYNEGVRAVDLSGNFIEDADLLTYINSSKHEIGLPTLKMLSDGNCGQNKKIEKVFVHDQLSELDQLSRLRRHGMALPGSSSHGTNNSGSKGKTRPESAPITGRRLLNESFLKNNKSNGKKNRPQVILDFPPKTSAVNAVQRVILDSITRVEAHNPFRRTENVDERGRQSLSGGSAGSKTASKIVHAKSQRTPRVHSSNMTPRGLYLSQHNTLIPLSARSNRSTSSVTSNASKNADVKSSTIRARLRLPPKKAESASLLRTAAGMGPKERKAKFHAEEQKMLQKRKEAEMLLEAISGSQSSSRNGSRVLNEDEGVKDDNDEELNEITNRNVGDCQQDEDRDVEDGEDLSLRPKYGGKYAHEIFWPAFACARNGNYSGVVEWLDKGMAADVREPETGQSLLMACAVSNSDITIRLLLRRGGKINGRCNKGWTPLHHCIASGSPYLFIADQLISRGAKTEIRDNTGTTALQLAVEQGSPDAICRLIEAGADIRTADDEGRTVLHRVAARKFFLNPPPPTSPTHKSINY